MTKLSARLLIAAAVLALFVVGCSEPALEINGPQKESASTEAPVLKKSNGVPGSYIVVLKNSLSDTEIQIADMILKYVFKTEFRYTSALKGFACQLTDAQVAALAKDLRIAYIEQNQYVQTVTTQSGATWGLDRIDQRNLPLDTQYTFTENGTGVDAYVIDTGILKGHSDFGGRAVTGYDAITSGGTAEDGNGHGTHVAGTIGGSTWGVAKNVRLIAVRVLNNSGSGTIAQVVAGIDWVTANHTTNPAVANMSLGGSKSDALDTAVKNSIADGVVYCVAAGNETSDASTRSPAGVTDAITVGATDSQDAFASFSNYGSVVDISAPGVSIKSAWYTSTTATNTISGTSMATPHVTGAVALYLQANPGATPAEVSSAITAKATSSVITGLPGGTVNRLLYTGSGTVQPPPAAPTLVSPASGTLNVTIPAALAWNASVEATSYTVQVSTSQTFTTLAYSASGVTTTSASASGLTAGTAYYWRVLAANANGNSDWSSIWSFTTAGGAVPAAPRLRTPSNGATNQSLTPTLGWYSVTGATSYRLQVSTSSTFATSVVDLAGITTTSSVVSGLTAGTTYYWRVLAANANGEGPWSSARRFTTAAPQPPAAPRLQSPSNNATNVSQNPTLSWYASTGATSYNLQVSTSSTFATKIVDLTGITTTSAAVSGLASYTRYYWRVSATNANGTSAWSSSRYFRTVR